jgi:alkylation response protein AidB-like acyl-CoA dehydrogenase
VVAVLDTAAVDFSPDSDEELIRDAVRAVCRGFDDAYWAERDARHEFPWEFYGAMADGGWVGIAIPEAYGGGGRGINEASLILEEVAASGAAMNGCSAVHLSIFGMHPVVLHGSAEMRGRYLPRVAKGDLHVAFGVTEPDAGTDTPSIKTRAYREPDGSYRIRGRKVWTSKALEAERVLLLCRTTPLEECAKRTDGMTLFLADLKDPAVTICGSRRPTASVRRAGGSGTSSTGSTPSGFSSPPRRSVSGGRRCAGRWPTPRSGSSSGGPSARTRRWPSRWPRSTPGCGRRR